MTEIISSPCGLYYKGLGLTARSWIQNPTCCVHSFIALSGLSNGCGVTGVGWMSPPSHDWEENRCSSMAQTANVSALRTFKVLSNQLSSRSVVAFCFFPAHEQMQVKSTWPLLEQQWESQWQISSIVSSQINQCTLPEHAIVYKLLQLSDLSEIGTGERQADLSPSSGTN